MLKLVPCKRDRRTNNGWLNMTVYVSSNELELVKVRVGQNHIWKEC